MRARTADLQQLSRRLLANYLMFGLLSIIALAVGAALTWWLSAGRREGADLLRLLGTAASTATDNLAADDAGGLQSLVEDLGRSADLLFCTVVSADGVYLAHSNPRLVGQQAPRSFSEGTASGAVERVSYLRPDHRGPREYWLPLRRGERSYGVLQAGVKSERLSHWPAVSQHAGAAVILPMLLLVLGGFKLNGVIKSSSTIERQLAELSGEGPGAGVELHPVEVRGPASAGWNRLVSHCAKSRLLDSLEARLQEALGGCREEKCESILHGMTDGVAATDEEGAIVFANKAFAVLLNADPETLRGAALADVVLRGMSAGRQEFERQMREPSRPGVVELRRTDELADGVLRLARWPLPSEQGGSRGQLWSLRDITQQKLVEHTRDQFIDTATHELRTPLSTIKACAETLELEEDIDLELQKQYLNTINMEATRLGRFVDEFLNISRIEAGSLAVNRHEVDFERLLSDVVAKVKPQLELKQIEFQLLLPPKLPKLSVDKDKLSAAIINLLGNAAKYTPEAGRVTLQVELAGAELRIHVEDTGIGISEEELPRVFNRFFRSDDERVRDVTGTGLGLAFAQEVVRLHGGRISVKSELEHGSRFTVCLPL